MMQNGRRRGRGSERGRRGAYRETEKEKQSGEAIATKVTMGDKTEEKD